MDYREIAETLVDREAVTLPNGDVLRFRQGSDEHTELNDFDYLGRTEWVRASNVTGCHTRPAGMDGCAEILAHDRGNVLWWQPPVFSREDRRQWHTDAEYARAVRGMVRDVVAYGFATYTVELCRGTDAYGRAVVVDVASLGGIEPFADRAYMVETVGELVSEVLAEVAA
jgi:hypothetical protein